MARKSSVQTYVSILDELRETIAPAYFLHGEEIYLQDQFLQILYQQYTQKYKTDWNKYVYRAGETDAGTILNQLIGGTLFAEPKVLVIKDVDELESSAKDALLNALTRPTTAVTVVLIKENSRVTDKFSKALKKVAKPITVKIPWIYEMDQWVQYFLKQREIQGDADVRSALVDLAGESLQSLANELEKIEMYLPQGSRTLTVDLLEEIVGATRTHSIFEFVDVLGAKSLPKVLDYLFSLLEERESVSYIVRKTADFYIEIWTLKAMMAEKHSDQEINRVIFNGRNLAWKYRKFATRFSVPEIRRALPLLEQADINSKTSGTGDPKNFLTALFYEILMPQQEAIHE